MTEAAEPTHAELSSSFHTDLSKYCVKTLACCKVSLTTLTLLQYKQMHLGLSKLSDLSVEPGLGLDNLGGSPPVQDIL